MWESLQPKSVSGSRFLEQTVLPTRLMPVSLIMTRNKLNLVDPLDLPGFDVSGSDPEGFADLWHRDIYNDLGKAHAIVYLVRLDMLESGDRDFLSGVQTQLAFVSERIKKAPGFRSRAKLIVVGTFSDKSVGFSEINGSNQGDLTSRFRAMPGFEKIRDLSPSPRFIVGHQATESASKLMVQNVMRHFHAG